MKSGVRVAHASDVFIRRPQVQVGNSISSGVGRPISMLDVTLPAVVTATAVIFFLPYWR